MTNAMEADFIFQNWERLISMGISKNRKQKQLQYYHNKYNSETEESKSNKKKRAEAYRNRYNNDPEVREKQKERMRAYRNRQKQLLAVAQEIA